MIATIVDWEAILDVVLASLFAGVGVTIAFSLAILGTIRFADLRRDGKRGESTAFGVLAAAMLGLCAAALVAGIVVMASK